MINLINAKRTLLTGYYGTIYGPVPEELYEKVETAFPNTKYDSTPVELYGFGPFVNGFISEMSDSTTTSTEVMVNYAWSYGDPSEVETTHEQL